MKIQDDYIPPQLVFFPTFDDAFTDDPQKARMLDFLANRENDTFKSLLSFDRIYLIAEPGYGKTRLLRQIIREAPNFGKEAIFIDLKKVIEHNLIEAIENQAKVYDCKTDGFVLSNEEKVVFCFDALDEIKTERVSEVVEQLKLFVSYYNKASIIISCRRHYFKQQLKNFSIGQNFRFVRIFPFSREQVNSYLISKRLSENEIEELTDLFLSSDKDLVIQTPRYLELLVAFLKEKKGITLKEITRTRLFEYFVDKKLEHEDLKLNKQNRDLAKRLLEIIALIMEIYQTNVLKKDELMSILGDTKSSFPTIFLQQVQIENLYNNSVLKADIETVEFDNTEFQEYLAAKEIIRLGENKRIAFDLFVDSALREIHPNWFNVLRFLLEMDSSLLKSLLDFGRRNSEKPVEDEEYHRLLLSVNIELLKAEEKKAIFDQIFIYYQDVEHWLDDDIAKKLAYCFDLSHYDLLMRYIDPKCFKRNETKRWVNCGNVAKIMGFLIEIGIINETKTKFWKKKLIEFAKDKNENGVLQRNALRALAKLKDDTVIQEVESVWQAENEHIKDQFLSLCHEVNPNHEMSIMYSVKGIKEKSLFTSYARHGIYEITSAAGVKKLLEYFKNDHDFLKKFVDHESSYRDKDRRIIENIENVWDCDIEKLLNEIIIEAYAKHIHYWGREIRFLPAIALLLKKKKRDYLFELLSQLDKSDKAWDNIFELSGLFAELLEVDQVERFVHELAKIEDARFCARRTLQEVRFSKRDDAGAIYEAGRQFFREEYEKAERDKCKRDNRPSEEERLYHQFKIMLEPIKGQYNEQVFDFYLEYKDTIGNLVQEDELNRLRTLITGRIFEKFDPGEQNLKIIERDSGGTQYSTHSWISIFGSCIILANELAIDVKKYRGRILNYIPFAYSDHLNSIFALVENITKNEIESFISVYKERKSDLWRFMPENLIRASEQYHIQDAAPILREFINENELSSYNRIRALKTAEYLISNQEFLKETFARYINSELELRAIAFAANSLLVEYHNDETAIDWRFQELESRAYPTKKRKDGEFYKSDEIREKEFAAPAMKLKRPNHEARFLRLLKKSFDLLEKDGYYPYAQYLWEIVCAYFSNRKEEKSYLPLIALEDFVLKHSNVEGINWFKYQLKGLKREYMLYVGKPSSVHDCIKKYNILKSQQYVDISTPEELKEKVIEIIDSDLRKWVESGGAYSFMKTQIISQQEDLIQKTVLTQLENALLRRGFRDVDITREPQLLDMKRIDFRLISYGFTGPILIEVKRSRHQDLNRKDLKRQKSFKSLRQYMNGYKACFGVFLVFDDKKRTQRSRTWQSHFSKIKKAYETLENVTVLGIKC